MRLQRAAFLLLLLAGVSSPFTQTARAELPILPGFERWRSDLNEGAGIIYCDAIGVPETFIENTAAPDAPKLLRMTDIEYIRPPGTKDMTYAISYVPLLPDDPPQIRFAGGPDFLAALAHEIPEDEIDEYYRLLDFEIELKKGFDTDKPVFNIRGIAVQNTGKQFAPGWEFLPPVGELVFWLWVEDLQDNNMRLIDFEITQVGSGTGEVMYSGFAVKQGINDPNTPDVINALEWTHEKFDEFDLFNLRAMGWLPVDVELRPGNALDVNVWPYEGVFVRDPDAACQFKPELPSFELFKYEHLLTSHVTDLEHTGNFKTIPKLPETWDILVNQIYEWLLKLGLVNEDVEQAGPWSGPVLDFSGKEPTFTSILLVP